MGLQDSHRSWQQVVSFSNQLKRAKYIVIIDGTSIFRRNVLENSPSRSLERNGRMADRFHQKTKRRKWNKSIKRGITDCQPGTPTLKKFRNLAITYKINKTIGIKNFFQIRSSFAPLSSVSTTAAAKRMLAACTLQTKTENSCRSFCVVLAANKWFTVMRTTQDLWLLTTVLEISIIYLCWNCFNFFYLRL